MMFINQDQLINELRKSAKTNKRQFELSKNGADIVHYRAKWIAFEEAIKTCKELGKEQKEPAVEIREISPGQEHKVDNNFTNNVKIIINNQKKSFKLNDKDITEGDLIFKLIPELKLCSQRVSAAPPYLPDPFVDFCEKEIMVIHNGSLVRILFDSELDILNDPPEKVVADFKERIQKIRELLDTKKVIEFDI